MKKCRKLIPLLVAAITLFSLVTEIYAAEGNYVEVKSGSKEAKVKFTVEDILAFEGTVSTRVDVGFRVANMDAKVTKAKEDTGYWRTVQQETSKDQIVIVGESMPATITLTVTLISDYPMKDGAYNVTLTYGATNPNGTYSANRKLTAVIYVGMDAPNKEDASKPSTLSNSSAPSSAVVEEPEPVAPETAPVVEPEDDGSGRVDAMGMLDLSALRSMLEEAEKLKDSGRLDAKEMQTLQDAVDVAEQALQSDRQGAVDDAAYELYTVIEELGGPAIDEEVEPEKEKSGGGLMLPLIIAVVAVLGIAGILMYLYMKKKMRVKYEGAPIVDYEIGDDDIL